MTSPLADNRLNSESLNSGSLTPHFPHAAQYQI